jgi:hypothetical protein
MNFWDNWFRPNTDPKYAANDLRYEYRTVRYPKAEKKDRHDLALEEELKRIREEPISFEKSFNSIRAYTPMCADAYWRWTSEYRVDKDSPWVEMEVHNTEHAAEYACERHAKLRAAPKAKYLGKLP